MEVESRFSILLGFGTVMLFVAVLGSVVYKLSFPPVSDKAYLIVFHEPIPGLEKNSKVTLQGIAVGRVSRIELQQATREHSFQARAWITILPDWADRVVLYQDGAPRIRGIGNVAVRTKNMLQVGDIVRRIGIGNDLASVTHVFEVEKALGRIYREMLDEPELTYQLVLERQGQPVEVRLSGRLGELELDFSNVGTRAMLQTNLVTNIQHIELAGGSSALQALPSLADLARAKGQDISTFIASTKDLDAQAAVIPTAATALNRLFSRFSKKVPALLGQLDLFMLEANTAARKINEVLDNTRQLTDKDGDIARVLDNTDKTIRESHRLLKGVNDGGKLTSILERSDDLLGTLNTQIGKQGELGQAITTLNEVLENTRHWTAADGPLKAQLAQVQDRLKRVSGKLVDSLDNADRLLKDAQRQALGDDRLKKLLVQLDYSIRRDVRIALAQITESMRVFKQTMVQMQSNPDSFFLGKRSAKRR